MTDEYYGYLSEAGSFGLQPDLTGLFVEVDISAWILSGLKMDFSDFPMEDFHLHAQLHHRTRGYGLKVLEVRVVFFLVVILWSGLVCSFTCSIV